jgi:GR25 family glycosyltransferase involved in LPS biosynthesis
VLNVTGDPQLVKCLWQNRSSLFMKRELGVTLSHLKAVRTAYLNGDDVALIMEDDMSLALLPYWLFNVNDVIGTLRHHNVSWHSVQLQYLLRKPHQLDKGYIWDNREADMLDRRLYKIGFQWGGGAYLISREGMDEVIRNFLRNGTGGELLLKPVCENRGCIDVKPYYEDIFTKNYISLPPLFVAALDQPSEKDVTNTTAQPQIILDRTFDLTAYAFWRFLSQSYRGNAQGTQRKERP